MLNLNLDQNEIKEAIEQYLNNTFKCSTKLVDFKVVAGRSTGESRIELNVIIGDKQEVITPLTSVSPITSVSAENTVSVVKQAETEEVDEDEVISAADQVAVKVAQVGEPKTETSTPLVVQELKPVPGSFFANKQ